MRLLTKLRSEKTLILVVPDFSRSFGAKSRPWRHTVKWAKASTHLKDENCASNTNSLLSHKQLDCKAWNEKEKNSKKRAGQDFMVAKKIWRNIKKGADKLRAPGQTLLLSLDRAPGHVGKESAAELDKWRGKGNWMFQTGKMPDENSGGVFAFPFKKRTIGDLGKAIPAEDLRFSMKRAWKQVTPAVCKKARARVLRNMAMAKVGGRNSYGESMTKTMPGL
jgi:hypothetical protein